MMDEINNSQNPVVCLMAPTACGKTSLAYELYDTKNYELISVDSALIYKDMNIGTAKPTEEELVRYPHHLVDIIDPTETFSVAEFIKRVNNIIEQCHANDKIPFLVGGTMMYYMALFDGISAVPDSEPEIRHEVTAWKNEAGISALYQYLEKIDPITAQRLEASDSQRITRAIEVFKQTNKPISYWQTQPKHALSQKSNQTWFGLSVMPDRQWLHQRIELRLQQMWQLGFLQEVFSLLEKYPLQTDMPSMRCVGYRQVIEYLTERQCIQIKGNDIFKSDNNYEVIRDDILKQHNTSVDSACKEMKNKALYATRQLAKRQYTWLRKLNTLDKRQDEVQSLSKTKILCFDDIQKVKELLL